MNFKTTIVLLVALAVVGGVFWYSQLGEKKTPEQASEQATAGGGQKLLDLQSDQVTGFTLTDSDGNHTTVERSGAAWRMTEPVSAAAVDWQTQDLIRTLCDLRSQGRPASAPSDAGLDKPRYRVALSTSDGKTARIVIGNKNFTGDLMFAQVNDGEVNLIDSSLAKTLKTAADDLRDKHLLTANSLEVQQIRIITATGRLVLNKTGSKWKIVEPVEMPGDSEAISSLISTITGTEASEFVKPDSDDLAFARFDRPSAQMWLSTEAPPTRPTTEPAALPSGGQTLTIGAPDSLTKDHYFVRTSDGLVAKIAGSSLDNLKKTPLDLRDKDVVTILPEDVKGISLVKETWPAPATQNANAVIQRAPAVVLARRPKESPKPFGPTLPANLKSGARPTTAPAATAPATQPAQSLWIFAAPADKAQPADDSKVDALLGQFNPLHADKYLEKNPNSPPQQRYLVSLETKMQRYHVEFVRPSNGQSAYGIYDDLEFEIPTALLDALDADFHRTGP
ncbi:MAG: DUF4340 domain-containing protein [Tepidisphaeraceae bacterium]